MPFESGSVTFRMFRITQEVPENAVEQFAANAAPPQDSIGKEGAAGWVTGKHLLDRNITNESAILSGYIRLTHMRAVRKIPTPLFKAECKMEEIALLKAEGKNFLNKVEKMAIKKAVTERLQPGMPLQLSGIPIVIDPKQKLLYAGVSSDKQSDDVVMNMQATLKTVPVPMTPEVAAVEAGFDCRSVNACSFSPQVESSGGIPILGQDFLTWLWFFSEAKGGMAKIDGVGDVAVAVEGPLVFVSEEGAGSKETSIRKGMPVASAEAKSALLAGKKLNLAKLMLVRGEESWSGMVAADSFTIKGLKLPKGEGKMSPLERFQERMLAIETFKAAFLGLFKMFAVQRFGKNWDSSLEEIREWVKNHASK